MNEQQPQQPQQNQQQQQSNSMNFAPQPGTFAVPSSSGFNPVMSQEQYEALKRHHAQAQAARNNSNSNSANAPAPVAAAVANPLVGGNSTNSNANQPQQGPYMVLTQVAVPAHMLGQLTKNNPNQLQQLLQQQQQQQGSSNNSAPTAGSQPQILSFNQLPPHVQQQILLQQQQMQGQNQANNSAVQKQQAPQLQQQQPQQAQVWQQVQQASHQAPAQPQIQTQPQQQQKVLTMNDIQSLLKNNHVDANLVQQLLLNQMRTNPNTISNNNSAQATNENSLSDLLHSFNEANTTDKDSSNNSDISNTNKKLFLETQVQPVQRQNNDTYNDDDLFKFFEVENLLGEDSTGGEDFLNPLAAATQTKKPNETAQGTSQFQNLSSFLEPTPVFQQAGAAVPQVPSQPNPQAVAPAQVSSSVPQQQQQQPQLHHQRQPQHIPMPVPSQVPSQPQAVAAPTGGPSQGPKPAGASSQPAKQTFSLPSTMVPPTVLASVCTGKATKRTAAKKKAPASKRAKRMDTPQDVLMRLVEKQGHPDLQRIKSEDAGYDTMPSPLQLSSFGTQVVHAVHNGDAEMLGKLLDCGLSPNPCNQFRDSILDLVCKRNNVEIFKCLLEHGSDLRVVDGFGRTPLHHCAWASSFTREIAEAIVERDPLQLFIEDKRGQTPMEYVRSELLSDWSAFLEEMADKFWPKGGSAPKLVRPKESRPDGTLPDPKNAVSAGLASMISSGNITLGQFEKMDEGTKKSYG